MVPLHNKMMQTSIPSIYIAGDISGVEEASTAMEEGRMAGLSAAFSLGYVKEDDFTIRYHEALSRMDALRSGMFGQKRRDAKNEIFSK